MAVSHLVQSSCQMVMNASIQQQEPVFVVCTCLCRACVTSEPSLRWEAAFFSMLTNAQTGSRKGGYYLHCGLQTVVCSALAY